MDLDEALTNARQAATDYEAALSLSEEADAAERLVAAFRALDESMSRDGHNRPDDWSGSWRPGPPRAQRFEACPTRDRGVYGIRDSLLAEWVSSSIGDAIIAGVTVWRSEERARTVANRMNAEYLSAASATLDHLDIEETGERRLPVAASVNDLPASTTVPLPVTCWVHSTGMYVMATMGEWRLLHALDHPTAIPAPEVVRPTTPAPETSLFDL